MEEKDKHVLVIGAAIADITGISENIIRKEDSNPGKIIFSAGGVARNIAENLARLKTTTHLISCFGNDYFGKMLVTDAHEYGLGIRESFFTETYNTATYMCVTNNDGNLDVAIADVENISCIDAGFLKSKNSFISNFKNIAFDTNLREDTIEYITNTYKEKKIFVDTVSGTKARKIKNYLQNIYSIKSNVSEIYEVTGIEINKDEDFKYIADFLLYKGVKQGFITRGKEGCFYFNQQSNGFIKSKEVNIINSSGAGDAFAAGIIFAEILNENILNQSKFATACAIIATQHKYAVNPNISMNLVRETIAKYL